MADDRWSEIRERGDAALLAIGFSDDWTDHARTRYVQTPDEARRLLARRGPSWRGRYGATLRCEIEQYEAARAIGVDPDGLRIRVTLQRSRPPGRLNKVWYGTHPELLMRHRGPKLAIAAVYAAPHQPTEFDLDRLRDFGYDSVIDVVQRVAAWNADDANDLVIPMPLGS